MGGSDVMRFHGFLLDTGRRQLVRGGRPVHLTRKAFDLLATLVEHAPLVVTKDELHRRLWPDAFVTDATIAGVVKEVRRALDTRHVDEPLIRTVHGVGYAFVGTVKGQDLERSASALCCLVAGTRRLLLGEGTNEIGRDPSAGVWLDEPLVSRRHARLTVVDGAGSLEDLGSKNRTLVNDRPVTGPTPLHDGDILQIGSTILTFRVTTLTDTTKTAPARKAH